MKKTPPLQDGEVIVHHHKPSLRGFQRTALLLLAITLIPTAFILYLYPDTFWGAVPLFVTCLVLMQERFTLGKYSAWITNQRVLWQNGDVMALGDIADVNVSGHAVRLRGEGRPMKLTYPADSAALIGHLQAQRGQA